MARLICLLAALILSACASTPPPVTSMLTEGFHRTLTPAGTPAAFATLDESLARGSIDPSYDFSGHTAAVDAISTWLQQHGLVIVTTNRDRLLAEQRFRLQHESADAVRVGRMQGAALLLDVRITNGSTDPTVTIRATSVETGEVAWSGSAKMPPRTVADYSHKNFMGEVIPLYRTAQKIDGQTLSLLACHALRTAFCLEPPGTYQIRLDRPCAEP